LPAAPVPPPGFFYRRRQAAPPAPYINHLNYQHIARRAV